METRMSKTAALRKREGSVVAMPTRGVVTFCKDMQEPVSITVQYMTFNPKPCPHYLRTYHSGTIQFSTITITL